MKARKTLASTFLRFFPLALVFISMIPPVSSYDFSVWRKVIGPQNVFIIAVQFPDRPALTEISDIENRVFAEMDSYYRNVSYGKITLAGDISETWILLPHNMSYYGDYDNRNDHSSGARALINDAIDNSDAFIDFSRFDYVLVVHAGEDEAYSHEVTDIWSWGYWEGLLATTDDGVTFNQGAVVSENDTLGVFCHEFGHIIGLPDLYNSDNDSSKSFVENWGLMGNGDKNGDPTGSKPAHILSWGKMFLGWIDSSQIIEIAGGQSLNATVEPLEKLSAGAKVVKISVALRSYYLIEVRIDDNLPEQGILITFVNETKNSGEGIVEVINSNFSMPSLNDATFHVGDIFEETQHHFTVKVLKQFENSSFTVQISNKLVPYINIVAPGRIEACQGLQIKVKIANYNGIPLRGLITNLYINEQKYQTLTTDVNGTATFVANFDLSMIGKNQIEVYVSGGDYYINNQIEQILEVTFPQWLLRLILAIIFGTIFFLGLVWYFKVHRIRARRPFVVC